MTSHETRQTPQPGRFASNSAVVVDQERGGEIIRFTAESLKYDADYTPGVETRATTNFANLARNPATRRRNITKLFEIINRDLNLFLVQDGDAARYEISLEVISIRAKFPGVTDDNGILLTEIMGADVVDSQSGEVFPGPTGLNFSSYLRDYDFKIVLPKINAKTASRKEIEEFGRLHGLITRLQFGHNRVVPDYPTVAISISQSVEYLATDFVHPMLGREYAPRKDSLTDRYFSHMDLRPRFFRPFNLPAPIAFYSHVREPLCDRSDFFISSLLAVMGNFQRIYRPEIYLSRTAFDDSPGKACQISLSNRNFDPPPIDYDKGEREVLSDSQAYNIEKRFLKRYPDLIEKLKVYGGIH